MVVSQTPQMTRPFSPSSFSYFFLLVFFRGAVFPIDEIRMVVVPGRPEPEDMLC